MNLKKTEVIMRSFKVSVVRSLIVLVAMLMLGTSTFAQVSVTLPNVAGVAGATGSGAITVGDLTGKNVTAFQFTLSYDKSIIYITGANTTNTLASNNAPTVNADTANGKILVAWASATALTGSGNLVNLNFTFRKSGQSTLNFGLPNSFMFNAGTPATTITNGSATIPQVLVQGGSISARVGGTFKIPITVSAITSAENVVSYDFVASYNKSIIKITGSDLTGTLSAGGVPAINVDTTAGTVRFALASSAKIITATGGTLLYLTGTAVGAGTTSLNFTSFEFNQGSPLAGANSASITVKVAPTLTLSPVGPSYAATDGVQLKITLVGADNPGDVLTYSISAPATPPAGATITGNIFTWTPTVAQRSATPYSFTFKVMDQDSAFATKTVTVTVAQNVAPTLTLNPAGPSYTVNEGVLLSITLVGADQNPADVAALVYSISAPATLPAGAKLTTNVFSWTPTFPEGRTAPYSFTFKVTDPFGASATSTVSITVVHVNRAPVFTVVPDYVVAVVNVPTPLVYRFQYVAVDPDGNNVSYSLIAGPVGSAIDAVSGVFTWAPTVDQTQHVYTVTIQATDGLLSSTTSQFIGASPIVSVQKLNEVPTNYSLSQNYPNPFNPTTSIQFGIPKEGFVKLSVFNVIGQEIKVLVNENMSAGNYKVNFDASKLNSGMYLYRIEAKDYTSVRKMLLVK
jgi:hypothetical protein